MVKLLAEYDDEVKAVVLGGQYVLSLSFPKKDEIVFLSFVDLATR
jgi:hypothetical protein